MCGITAANWYTKHIFHRNVISWLSEMPSCAVVTLHEENSGDARVFGPKHQHHDGSTISVNQTK